MHENTRTILTAELVVLEPAKAIRRPRTLPQPFSRSAAQAAAEDGVDLGVTVRLAVAVEAAAPATSV